MRNLTRLAIMVAGLAISLHANAAAELEEVIVTAQRVEESLQEVPISVTALNERDLELRGMSGPIGLIAGTVPSINVQSFAARPATLNISIRGIGVSDPAQDSFEQAVAVYVDGIYMARGSGIGLDILELERMEVLRGPQGTLFGRNAMGGAVNMISRKPGGEWRFKQMVDVGRFGTLKYHTTVETKEFSGLSFKFDYRHAETDGWQDNDAYPSSAPSAGAEDFGQEDQDAFRIAARWQPTETFTADYVYDNTDLDYVQDLNHLVIGSDVGLFSNVTDQFVADERFRSAPAPGYYAQPSTNEGEGHTLTLEWQASDLWTLKFIGGYRELYVDSSAINGWGILSPSGIPGVFGVSGSHNSIAFTDQDQTSAEIQAFGSTERLKYTLGALYFEESSTNTLATRWAAFTPGFFAPPDWQFLDTPYETPSTSTDVDLKAYGVYGQVTWTPAILDDRLDITVGLRYSDENKDLERTLLNDVPVSIPIEANEDRVDPAVTLDYKIGEATTVYTRYATGFRGGGASVRELPDSRPEFQPDTGFNPFGPDEVESYELGLKSDFWDRRARLNASVFYQEQKDLQVSFQKDSVANTRVFNLDETVKVKGVDVEFTILPVEGMTLTAGGTWLDDNIDSLTNPQSGEVEEFRIDLRPDFKWSLSADYTFPIQYLGGDLNFFASLTGSDFYCFNGRSCFGRYEGLGGGSGSLAEDNNTLLNARLTLSEIPVGGGTLKIAAWGNNLLDSKYYHFGFTVPGINSGMTNYGDMRSYGVSATYEFVNQ